MFNTYGPFVLEKHDGDALDKMFIQIRDAREDFNLQHGVGVYILFTKTETNELVPWYVGQTHDEFGSRIKKHFDDGKFRSLLDQLGPLNYFLLLRVTPGGRIFHLAKKNKKSRSKSILGLEFALIGTCLKLNGKLLNKQESAFHQLMYVPGYIDNGIMDRQSPAALALSKLLKT